MEYISISTEGNTTRIFFPRLSVTTAEIYPESTPRLPSSISLVEQHIVISGSMRNDPIADFAVMENAPKRDDTYSDAETEARREAALRYALTTPPKPHEAMRKGRGESRKKA